MSEAHDTAKAAVERLGLTMEATFVPFSQSRNKDEKDPSLNWIVRLLRAGREILTTDYGAGSGHCPASKLSVTGAQGISRSERKRAIACECEEGRVATPTYGPDFKRGKPLPTPDICDVLYCLLSDGDAIDHPTYEDWASDYGYDPDSRKGEAIYRACLEIGLKLRAALGDDGLRELREAFQDY